MGLGPVPSATITVSTSATYALGYITLYYIGEKTKVNIQRYECVNDTTTNLTVPSDANHNLVVVASNCQYNGNTQIQLSSDSSRDFVTTNRYACWTNIYDSGGCQVSNYAYGYGTCIIAVLEVS